MWRGPFWAPPCPANMGDKQERGKGTGQEGEGLARLGALPSSKQVAVAGLPEVPSGITQQVLLGAQVPSFQEAPGMPFLQRLTGNRAWPSVSGGGVSRTSPDRPPELLGQEPALTPRTESGQSQAAQGSFGNSSRGKQSPVPGQAPLPFGSSSLLVRLSRGDWCPGHSVLKVNARFPPPVRLCVLRATVVGYLQWLSRLQWLARPVIPSLQTRCLVRPLAVLALRALRLLDFQPFSQSTHIPCPWSRPLAGDLPCARSECRELRQCQECWEQGGEQSGHVLEIRFRLSSGTLSWQARHVRSEVHP